MRKSFQALMPNVVRRGVLVAGMLSATLLYSTLASALGMGEITLNSALNQPLNADIELIETSGLGPEDIVARLASPEDFARAGVERAFFFNDLRFIPIIHGNRGVLRVVSTKPVTEPYLNFLVQLVRPNGDLLHEYTVLLDPATTPEGMAATRGRARAPSAAVSESRMPVAPPAALQGKHYVVAGGDTLNSIARRMQGSGPNASPNKLADGIKALNPQAFPNGDSTALKVGQTLLLPDAAVLPKQTQEPATAAATAPQNTQPTAEALRGAEQLTTAAIENQALSKTVEDLKAQMQALQEQVAGKDKEVVALQTALSEVRSAPPGAHAPAPVTGAASPVLAAPSAPTVVIGPATSQEPWLSPFMLLALLLLLLLMLGLVWSVRRNRRKAPVAPSMTLDLPQVKPVQPPVVPVFEVPDVAPRVVAPAAAQPTATRQTAPPDALDGVSIYIAYGRFAEAMGILRDALQKQPQRHDIRVRILELLAEQGDSAGFAKEEHSALQSGMEPAQLQEIRARYPQLAPAATSIAPASEKPAVAAPVAAAAAAAAVVSASLPPVSPAAPQPAPSAGKPDESLFAAPSPQPADEFQLNLDDLSMDADWDLVDPFDNPKAQRGKPEVEAEPEHDPAFASNLSQLPEVFEIPDDQFLSDFSEPEPEFEPQQLPLAQADSDALDDDFLDGFMSDSTDFDLFDIDEAPLSKINQAQVLIDDGDVAGARELLLQVIEESDEDHQQTARDLLSGLN